MQTDTFAKILIRSPNWIGDQVLAYPFFHMLRKSQSQAHIVVACLPWVEALQYRDLVDEVHVLDKPASIGFFHRFDSVESGARRLRKMGPWDLGIAMPRSFSTAWLLFRSSVKHRRGYKGDGRGLLLNDALEWQPHSKSHRATAFAALVPGHEPGSNPPEPVITDRFDFERSWFGLTFLEPPDFPYWVLAPGSVAESRRWPVDRFIELAKIIYAETGWKGLVVGGAAEASLASLMLGEALHKNELLDWTARGRVSSYASVFRNAKFTVSNDSGLAHVASLCGSPVQIVWGAGDPRMTAPIGPGKVKITCNPIECWPCEQNTCPIASQTVSNDGKNACLKGIKASMVWNDIKTGILTPDYG
ncbi:MAG: glycosyltransferase family 9 protein [Bdellovibrionota bacterium]